MIERSLPSASAARGSLLDRFILAVRTEGTRGFAPAVTAIGIVAGLLSASNISLPLWFYILLLLVVYLTLILWLAAKRPRYRYLLPGLLVRSRVEHDRQGRPHIGLLAGSMRGAPVPEVLLSSCPDTTYLGGFRALTTATDPAIISASSPRDVSQPQEGVPVIYRTLGGDTPIELGVADGFPRAVSFLRSLPGSEQDLSHSLAVKDLVGLPHLALAFGTAKPLSVVRPLVWPEHCVDAHLLSENDLIVVGGGDTNFWHGALFEMLWQDFCDTSIPLALSLRHSASGDACGRYASERIAARLHGLSDILAVEEQDGTVFLNEREHPTYAMILSARNPLSRESRTCTFVAGTRSLGTAGATWALAAMVEQMRMDPESNFGTWAPTKEPDVAAGVSAALVRTTKVFHAMRRKDGAVQRGGVRAIPTDRRDPRYSDTYLPAEVELFVNDDGPPRWEVVASAVSDQALEDTSLVTLSGVSSIEPARSST